jgi:hypothetical protein
MQFHIGGDAAASNDVVDDEPSSTRRAKHTASMRVAPVRIVPALGPIERGVVAGRVEERVGVRAPVERARGFGR